MEKIAICSPGFKPVPAVRGGAVEQLTTYILMENEKKHDYEIDVYTCSDELLSNMKFKYTHIVQVDDKQKKIFFRIFYAMLNRIYLLFGIQEKKTYIESAIIKSCLKQKYKLILVENNMNVFNGISFRDRNTDMYFHLHNDIDCGDFGKTKNKTINVVNRAKKVIAASDFVKERVEKVTGACNVITIHNCLDEDIFNKDFSENELESLKSLSSVGKESLVILFVGRMDLYKGALELVEAVNLLPANLKIECVIIGANWFGSKEEREYQEHVKELAKQHPERYHFIKYVEYEQMPKMYALSDIIVIPSRCEEVFGMVALEAMYMGKPVVASKRGALYEVLGDGCALFVDEMDFVNDLKKKILCLCEDENMRKKMGEAGKERARQFFCGKEEYYECIRKTITPENLQETSYEKSSIN